MSDQTQTLVEVRCPLKRPDRSNKTCNRLCVRVSPGSSGQAYCPRHDVTFDFEVDDSSTFNAIIIDREAIQSGPTALPEHP